MKNLALLLLASLALTHTVNAATAPLAESLREIEAISEAIGTNPDFQDIIPSNEFITKIARINRRINNTGKVFYKIITRTVREMPVANLPADLPEAVEIEVAVEVGVEKEVEEQIAVEEATACRPKHHGRSEHAYVAKILVTPNDEEIGPNNIQVLKINKIKHFHCN